MTLQIKKHRMFRRVLLIASVLLFLLLMGFQSVPLSYGSSERYIAQASLQLARSNGFAKSALLLQHGTASQQAQALSDMQVTLPLFEAEQSTLLKSNQQDLQQSLQLSRISYLAIITATATIIDQGSTVDATQVSIITDNSKAYNITMNQFLLILQNEADAHNLCLVFFQEGITVLLAVCVIALRHFAV